MVVKQRLQTPVVWCGRPGVGLKREVTGTMPELDIGTVICQRPCEDVKPKYGVIVSKHPNGDYSILWAGGMFGRGSGEWLKLFEVVPDIKIEQVEQVMSYLEWFEEFHAFALQRTYKEEDEDER